MSINRKGKNTKVTRLLSQKDKGANSVTGLKGVPAHIFRRFLALVDMEPGRWDILLKRYRQKIEADPNSATTASNISGNLSRMLVHREMTWITLMKGLCFLGATGVEVTFKAKFPNDKILTTSTDVEFIDGEMIFDSEDDPDQCKIKSVESSVQINEEVKP